MPKSLEIKHSVIDNYISYNINIQFHHFLGDLEFLNGKTIYISRVYTGSEITQISHRLDLNGALMISTAKLIHTKYKTSLLLHIFAGLQFKKSPNLKRPGPKINDAKFHVGYISASESLSSCSIFCNA